MILVILVTFVITMVTKITGVKWITEITGTADITMIAKITSCQQLISNFVLATRVSNMWELMPSNEDNN